MSNIKHRFSWIPGMSTGAQVYQRTRLADLIRLTLPVDMSAPPPLRCIGQYGYHWVYEDICYVGDNAINYDLLVISVLSARAYAHTHARTQSRARTHSLNHVRAHASTLARGQRIVKTSDLW